MERKRLRELISNQKDQDLTILEVVNLAIDDETKLLNIALGLACDYINGLEELFLKGSETRPEIWKESLLNSARKELTKMAAEGKRNE